FDSSTVRRFRRLERRARDTGRHKCTGRHGSTVRHTETEGIGEGDGMSDKENNMERHKSLEMAVSQIERQYGRGAIMKMGDAALRKVEVISTGALALDLALGTGGVPRGRIVEIYGPEASGKTSLALHIVAEAQRNGGIAAFIDAEH